MASRLEKFSLNFTSSSFVIPVVYLSSPSSTILVPISFIIISPVFFYLSYLLFAGFLWFKGNYVHGQNNSNAMT